MSSPDDYTPLNDEELSALEYFVESSLPKGMPSMVRRLLREVRDRRAADSAGTESDGWLLKFEEPDPAQPG